MKNSPSRVVRTTVDLPAVLLRHVEAALRRGVAKSRNALVVRALIDYFDRLERERIDAEFERMAQDPGYLKIVRDIERQWSPASDAAWRIIDATEQGATGTSKQRTKRKSHASR